MVPGLTNGGRANPGLGDPIQYSRLQAWLLYRNSPLLLVLPSNCSKLPSVGPGLSRILGLVAPTQAC